MHSIINDIEVTNTPNGMRNFYRRIKTNQLQMSYATRAGGTNYLDLNRLATLHLTRIIT